MTDHRDDVFAGGHGVGVFADDEPAELAGMDARILAAYRCEFGSERPWSRRVRGGLPVAALLLVGLLVGAVLTLSSRPASEGAAAPPANGVQDAPVVTQTSLAGFQPVDDMQAVVVREAR